VSANPCRQELPGGGRRVIRPASLESARRWRAFNPRPPLTEEQQRALVALFGPLKVPSKAARLAASGEGVPRE
jgi:hypothetical protein